MRHLLERTERADEIPDLARKYAEAQMMRRWLRWKPHLLTHQEVRGVENVDRTRSVILSFMHHNQYCGLFWSLDRVGIHCHLLALAEAMERTVSVDLRQHMRVMTERATVIPTTEGSKARSEEHTSELQSLMRISYAVFCLKKKKHTSTICEG